MLLYSIHDREGLRLVPSGGFCLDTIALSEKPNPLDYRSLRSDINWIVRLNWGYGSTGTYPNVDDVETYIQRAVDYVLGSKGIYAYIPGNEPNHENERPNGVVISPKYAAMIFSRIRKEIRLSNKEVLALTVPIAPYHASPMDWLYYLKEMLTLIANSGGADGIGIHAYVRGDSPEAVHSDDKMGPPLTGQYNSFRTYRDALSVVPSSMKKLPTFITESNLLVQGGWPDRASGVIPAIYEEINTWNGAVGSQKVFCVCMYRYPKYDQWFIEGKNGVIADFQNAVSKGYKAPVESSGTEIHLPFVPNEPLTPPAAQPFEREIDPRAIARGVSIQETKVNPGQLIWKVKKIQWFDEQEADRIGPDHHILYDTLYLGVRQTGVQIRVLWSTGGTKVTSELKPGELFSANFPMTPGEYSTLVLDTPSEIVRGIQMGQMTPSGFNPGIHTSTFIEWELVKEDEATAEPPVSMPVNTVPPLVHPVANPKHRTITQTFGVNEWYYKQFVVGGVPLKGHNGLDFGTPVGSQIVAVDNGQVVEVANDPGGYGKYVKLVHVWGESLYAHLDSQFVKVGDISLAGHVVGISGNTGKSTGPHLHFGMRVNPYNRSDGWGGYTDPQPYLVDKAPPINESQDLWQQYPYIVAILSQVAQESSLEYELLASLAWAESSFRPDLDDGLFQIGEMAWDDYFGLVGAKDINNPLDNARVAAAYFKWLLGQFNDDIWKALYAWNWGIGNVLSGKEPPEITKTFANKVIHGYHLLKAIGD